MSETDPIVDVALPRGAQGGVELCHACRTWRATEIVRDVDGIPTCEVCSPLEPDPPPRKKAAAKRTPARKTATRRSRK